MTSVLLGPILLSLALIVVAAQLMGPRREHAASALIESRWVLGSGLLFGVLATWVLSPVYLSGVACVPDFYEYCQAMLYLDGSHGVYPAKRSQFTGQLPYLLSTRLGILDGLALAGVLCTCVVGACIYAWARMLGGRAAGLSAAAFALAMAPLAVLPRFLGFYPELSAGFCLAATATAAAIMAPGRLRMVLAGGAIGLSLLLDVRGLFWALPYLGGALIAALIAARTARERLESTAALGLPVVLSWFCGRLAWSSDSTPLEEQIDIRPLFYNHGVGDAAFQPPFEYSSGYLWGWSSPLEIPSTLIYMWEQRVLEASVTSPLPPPKAEMLEHHQAWGVLLGLSAVLVLVASIRQPRVLAALAVTVLPFWVSYRSIGGMTELSARFYTHALPGIAVVAGVAVGMLLRVLPRWSHRGLPRPGRATLLVVLLCALLMGWLPSWMSTSAQWRTPFTCHEQDLVHLPNYHGADPETGRLQVECASAIYGESSAEVLPLSIY